MKTYISLLSCLLLVMTTLAQNKEKIKGNREVTTVIYELDPFTGIDIREELEITLINGTKPQVEINTDENLHEVFEVNVVDGTLTIATTKEIRSSKRLEIFITVSESLQRIHVEDEAELKSLTTLTLKNAEFDVLGDAELDLKVKSDTLIINGFGKTKQRYELFTSKLILNALEDAKIQMNVQAKDIAATIEYAKVELEGTTETLNLSVKEKGECMSADLVAKEVEVTTTEQAQIAVHATQKVVIDAKDRAEIRLLGSPEEITMRNFSGEAMLQKVDVNKKGFLKRIF